MNFFDRKEEVLELKLTSYGRSMLSRGEFSPTYYAFYDDDIIYDSQYISLGTGSQVEYSTAASKRIRDSIRPKTQSTYAGIETNINKLHELGVAGRAHELTLEAKLMRLENPPPAADNFSSMGGPMGSSKLNSDKLPEWDAQFVKGELLTPVTDYTGSSGLLKIPQLDVVVYYDIETKQLAQDQQPAVSEDITMFPDGTYVQIEKDYILLDLREYNSLFDHENFEIEVYRIPGEDTLSHKAEYPIPLYFANAKKVTEDLYYSEDMKSTVEIKDYNVEYFFDIRVDDEISDGVGLQNNIITDIYKKKSENDKEPC